MKEALKSIQVKLFLVFFFTALFCSLTTRVNDSYGIVDGKDGNLVILLSFFLNALFNSVFLAEYDERKTFTSHFSREVFRLILFSFFPIILTIQSGDYSNLLLIYYNLTIFYFFFEIFYNHLRYFNLWYIGNTAINDKVISWIYTKSKFMYKIYPYWYIGFKVSLFISSLILIKIYWL